MKKTRNLSRKLIAGLCSAALAATMTSFAVSADETSLNSYEADSSTVRLIGRTARVKDALWLTYTDSGVEFKCTGTQVKFNVKQSGNDTRVQVYVNGKVAKRGMVSGSSATITVDLEEGENTVKLIKLSESAQSVFAIDSIDIDGDAPTPTESSSRKIEFIGDSITCGYGADGTLKNSFSTATENGSETYAYQTALNLGADYSMVSVSGIGVVSGYTSNGKKNEVNGAIMPAVYTSTGFSWYWLDGATPTNLEWDFSDSDTDLVVINLGTNDYSYTKSDSEKCKEFEEGYESFLKTVREKNPNAEILCVLGLMGQELYENIENAVEAYKVAEGDEHVATFELSKIDANDGYGVDYHPNTTSHQIAAAELTEKISTLYGWETVEDADEGNYTVTREYTFTSDGETFVEIEQPAEENPSDGDNTDNSEDGNNNSGDDTDTTENPTDVDGDDDGDGDTENTDNSGETDGDDENTDGETGDIDEDGDSDSDSDGDDDNESEDGEDISGEDEDEDSGEDTDDEDSSDDDNSGAASVSGNNSTNSGSVSDNNNSANSGNASNGTVTSSGTGTNSGTDNSPTTGVSESLAAVALLCGAVIVLKKR
jgi:lysophospholipase L1-like esterase